MPINLIAILVLSFVGALAARPVALLIGRFCGWVVAILPASLFALFISLANRVRQGDVIHETISWVPSLGVNLGMRLDGFSLLFALLITGVGTLVVIYSGAYFADKPRVQAANFIFYILLFMTAMIGTVLSDDLIMMFVFWEMTSMMSFMLIGFEMAKPEARHAAQQALLTTGSGGLALLAAIILIGAQMDTFSFTEIAARSPELVASPWLPAILILIMIGAFTKSAQFPFHFWLPNAMQAPTPASAYLHSATMVKLGIYLLARFDDIFAKVPAFGIALVIIGSITMLLAAFGALRATGFKSILAQSTVASLGILVMLIGLDGAVATVATVGFILTHALYKAALFFCAGNTIHATGIASLQRLGGLAKVLPFTAAAALLASFSMAGLPPFIGFISKEVLFEAQLYSSWNIVPVLIAVLVNAVMVGVAGVISLRPFFLRKRKRPKVIHGETPGLLLGPLLLALAGVVMGIMPRRATEALIKPAANALDSTITDVSFKLWHGITPMLTLSITVVIIGVAISVFWDRIHSRLSKMVWVNPLISDKSYDVALSSILNVAKISTRLLQNGDQRRYIATTLSAVIAIVVFSLVYSQPKLTLDFSSGVPGFAPAALLILAVVGGIASTFMRSIVACVMGAGIVGFASATLFVLNGAPDLALTQFAVETLFIVVIMAVLLKLPFLVSATRTRHERLHDTVIAVAFSCLVFVSLAGLSSIPFDTRITDFYAEKSLSEAYGSNIVNVILVDFRAMDTMGEITVVAFAAVIVWGLLRRRGLRRQS